MRVRAVLSVVAREALLEGFSLWRGRRSRSVRRRTTEAHACGIMRESMTERKRAGAAGWDPPAKAERMKR